MKKLKPLFAMILLFTISNLLHAQEGTGGSGIGRFMRSEQRSYVVIAVMLTIVAGLILYIARLDRKISKLEKEK
jgi:cytochrome c biogenesis protein CcdA